MKLSSTHAHFRSRTILCLDNEKQKDKNTFQDKSQSFTQFLFWQGDWELGWHSMSCRHFPDISYFLEILSL